MAYTYERIDGQRVEHNVAAAFRKMAAAFKRDTGKDLRVRAGTRTGAEQRKLFLERYVLVGDVRGRRVYDTRWWGGRLWYRVSAAGTVAQPGTSNHEEGGPNGPRSLDLYDTGSDAGVTVRGSRRDKWMEANAGKFGFENEGYKFKEPWHKTYRGKIGGAPAPAKSGTEIKVKHYYTDDAKAKLAGGVKLAPGASFWLNIDPKSRNSNASNVVGGIGEYQFTVHLYAEGKAGDVVDVALAWDDPNRTDHSMHFVERVQLGADGTARRNFSFARAVASGFRVYAKATAGASNLGPVSVTRFATDALLFVQA